jgi:hypothetical protein
MDADHAKTDEDLSDFIFAGLAVLSPQTPSEVVQRTAFSYKPPDDPLETAHKHEMAKSRERFRQTLTLLILTVTILIALLITATCGYIALFDKESEIRKSALTVLAGIVGTLLGAVLGLNGAKLLGIDAQKEKE